MRGTHGWKEVTQERKREIIAAIASGAATRGPVHAELDLTDRCNIACYFCNQQDVRTKEQIPLKRAVDLIDELVETGLKSVRLSGGGDPLFHREIFDVLDHLERRGVVIDNLTTNGVALGPEIAERLVRNHAREVIFSLNAADPADYHRMMAVKPATFEKVLANIRHLVSVRGESIYPAVVCQFLIDRENFMKLPEMYRVARSLGVDRISIGPVGEIPLERIDKSVLIGPADTDALEPYVRQILEADRDAALLQIYFPIPQWQQMLVRLQAEIGTVVPTGETTASSFKEENGACFFAWYSATVSGNGDLYPCCLLLNPEYKPLGNTMEGKFGDQWNGPGFTRLREEMRDVLLSKNQIEYDPGRFKTLKPQCVEKHACWLKNMYFRGDDEFYRELGEALETTRKKEIRWLGTPKQMWRAAEIYSYNHPEWRERYDWLRNRSRPVRHFLARTFGVKGLKNESDVST